MFIIYVYFTLLVGGQKITIEANQVCVQTTAEAPAGAGLICVQLPMRVLVN